MFRVIREWLRNLFNAKIVGVKSAVLVPLPTVEIIHLQDIQPGDLIIVYLPAKTEVAAIARSMDVFRNWLADNGRPDCKIVVILRG